MQGPAAAAQKRPATPLDQLAYQRKLTYRRRIHASLEDRVREFLGASVGAESVRIVFGRVVGRGTQRDVVLPIVSEAILDGREHDFDAALPQQVFDAVLKRMEAERQAWQRAPPQARRWADFSVSEGTAPAPSAPSGEVTVYRGGADVHFQLQVGAGAAPSGQAPRHETRFVLNKGGGLWWRCVLCRDEGRIELEVNPQLLWEQHGRMQTGRVHSFSVLSNDVLRNARALSNLLRSPSSPSGCFYPGLLEHSAAVSNFYDRKVAEVARHAQSSQNSDRDLTVNVRRYNNLVKTLLLERHVDDLTGSVRVLDLGCGMGQDMGKYCRDHRRTSIDLYVGIDFAPAALEEAERRHKTLLLRNPGEYCAAFYAGDVRNSETFARIRRDGHGVFDVISMHFALSYVAESERMTQALLQEWRTLLRPGGRVLCALPSCEALAELFAASQDAPGPVAAGNSLYKVRFDDSVRARLEQGDLGEPEDAFAQEWGLPYTFTLAGSVEAQREFVVPWESLEALALANGFNVSLDASFPDLLREYSPKSPFFNKIFSKQEVHAELSEEDSQLFSLYTAFVLQRLDDSAENAPEDDVEDDF